MTEQVLLFDNEFESVIAMTITKKLIYTKCVDFLYFFCNLTV